MRFPIEILNNHLFVHLPTGRWLVDTGSPATFGEAQLEIGNQRQSVASGYGPISIGQIRGVVGVDFAGLLGTDILNRYVVEFDVPSGQLSLHGEIPADASSHRAPLQFIQGSSPVVTAKVEDQGALRLILDTGAQYSYLNTPPPGDTPTIGRGTDFHPFLGSYELEFFLRRVELGPVDADFQFSTHASVAQLCSLARVDGVLGLELLLTRRAIYNPMAKEICL